MLKSLLLVIATAAIANAAAGEYCPPNSKGTFPNCVCANNAKYDRQHNLCPLDLSFFGGECPREAPGNFPNCVCAAGKLFDTNKKVCTGVVRNVCPAKAKGTPPNCECPAQYELDDIHWICRPWYLKPTTTTYRPIVTHKPVQVRCPQNSLNPEEYVPFCRFNITTYVVPEREYCGHGLIGVPPHCYEPCPAYHYRIGERCERRRCPTGAGWTGEYAPDCKYTPSCPPEFPGIYPDCDIYRTTPRYLPPHDYLSNRLSTANSEVPALPESSLPEIFLL